MFQDLPVRIVNLVTPMTGESPQVVAPVVARLTPATSVWKLPKVALSSCRPRLPGHQKMGNSQPGAVVQTVLDVVKLANIHQREKRLVMAQARWGKTVCAMLKCKHIDHFNYLHEKRIISNILYKFSNRIRCKYVTIN